MLKEGDKAPSFKLESHTGEVVTLKDLKGKRVILYFYPKDDTPGCTKEACAFRDDSLKYKKANTVIFGVSKDTQESHKKFRQKYELPFPLLIDPDFAFAKEMGAWGEKNMYGKKVKGLIRSTFVIDEKGKIEKIYRNVRVNGHSEKVLENLA